MWQGRTVTVMLPAYNEAAAMADCVRDFRRTEVVDEVLVVVGRPA